MNWLTKTNAAIEKGCKAVAAVIHLDKKDVFEYVLLVVKALVITALLFTFVLRTVQVDGDSMQNTLMNEDRLIVYQLFYKPHQGDIVVITKNTKADGPIIKRVVAVAGQVVSIDFAKGIVYVDGKALEEPYAKEPIRTPKDVVFPQTVPEGCVFVLGDNRNNSHDSRTVDVGMVSLDYVIGKAIFRMHPAKEIGFLK